MKIELEPRSWVVLGKNGKPKHVRYASGIFRFKRGQYVWVRDVAHHKNYRGKGGFTIVQARVRERHYHPERHPFYLNGEGYTLDGYLHWDCYPGCRVFATREEAVSARMGAIR